MERVRRPIKLNCIRGVSRSIQRGSIRGVGCWQPLLRLLLAIARLLDQFLHVVGQPGLGWSRTNSSRPLRESLWAVVTRSQQTAYGGWAFRGSSTGSGGKGTRRARRWHETVTQVG